MTTQFVTAAIGTADFERIEDGTVFGSIPECPSVWAMGSDEEFGVSLDDKVLNRSFDDEEVDMQAVRVVKVPQNGRVILDLPPELCQGKQVEIIVLPVEPYVEAWERKPFNPEDYFGLYKNRGVDVDTAARELREEWNRGC